MCKCKYTSHRTGSTLIKSWLKKFVANYILQLLFTGFSEGFPLITEKEIVHEITLRSSWNNLFPGKYLDQDSILSI